jgi:hypothetical protein
MNRHSNLYRALLLLAAAALLAACGGGGAAEQPTTVAAPTRTPRPTREAAAENQPTRVPTREAAAEPTPVSDLAIVELGPLERYEHPSGAFSIEVPDNWTFNDNSNADELIIYWTDPTSNGALQVNIGLSSDQLGNDRLLELMQSFLDANFAGNDNFAADEPSEQSDGSLLVTWSFDVDANGVTTAMLGNSFVEQRGNVISILTTLVPQDQFDYLVPHTNEMINSYRINADTTDLGGGSGGGTVGDGTGGPAVAGDMVTFEHPSGTFTALVPENWEAIDQSSADELLLFWIDPSGNAGEIINIIESPTAYSSSRLSAHQLALLEALFGTEAGFTVGETEEQRDGSLRVSVEFTDEDAVGNSVAIVGYSFVEQRGDIIAVLTVIVPGDADDTLLEAVNSMIGGYSVNPAGSLD